MVDTMKALVDTQQVWWNELVLAAPTRMGDIVSAVFYVPHSPTDEVHLPRKNAETQAQIMNKHLLIVNDPSNSEQLFQCAKDLTREKNAQPRTTHQLRGFSPNPQLLQRDAS